MRTRIPPPRNRLLAAQADRARAGADPAAPAAVTRAGVAHGEGSMDGKAVVREDVPTILAHGGWSEGVAGLIRCATVGPGKQPRRSVRPRRSGERERGVL